MIHNHVLPILYLRITISKRDKEKLRENWFSRYFGQSSPPSSEDLMKIRKVVTVCSKMVHVARALQFSLSIQKHLLKLSNKIKYRYI